MKANPCSTCLVQAVCVATFYGNSVLNFVYHDKKCPMAIEFIDKATMDEVNEMRLLYGLEPYK
jgi:hypothetical protein